MESRQARGEPEPARWEHLKKEDTFNSVTLKKEFRNKLTEPRLLDQGLEPQHHTQPMVLGSGKNREKTQVLAKKAGSEETEAVARQHSAQLNPGQQMLLSNSYIPGDG